MPSQQSHSMGKGGDCICVKCGFTAIHQPGIPCREERCPICNKKLIRKGSQHHKMYLDKKQSTNK